jgi:carotenoid cleavage dioxygenase-like enzyme
LTYQFSGRYASEPLFVPDPTAESGIEEEDSGVLMFVELDVTREEPKSALVVLDARTLQEVARCETSAGTVVPFTFHGTFTLAQPLLQQKD